MKMRYLTYFSYIGTSFRSSEKIWIKPGKNYPDPESVQGLLELALADLRPLNYPAVVLSSRTDGGVHALNSAAHFDLDRNGTRIYQPTDIVYSLNKFFFKNNTPINVKRCLAVPENFSARYNAIRRSYLFRLAVLKQHIDLETEYSGIGAYIPIEEWKRCHFIRNLNFDIERFREGAKQLVGYHDFTTFKKFDKLNTHKHSRREIYSIDVRKGRPLLSFPKDTEERFEYWDIEIQGRAFVHNQIRRMIGTLICVARGKLVPDDIKVMLQVPSKHSWHSYIQCCPPEGLYLANVEYDPKDLVLDSEKEGLVSKELVESQVNKLS